MAKKKKKSAKKKREYAEHGRPLSEAEFERAMSEDFRDAWRKLRAFAAGLGEQRIYTSAKAIMFSRRVCYLFVRPKKSYLEVVFFLPKQLEHPLVKGGGEASKTKFYNTVRLIHADQVEEPLTDWVREAFEFVGA